MQDRSLHCFPEDKIHWKKLAEKSKFLTAVKSDKSKDPNPLYSAPKAQSLSPAVPQWCIFQTNLCTVPFLQVCHGEKADTWSLGNLLFGQLPSFP